MPVSFITAKAPDLVIVLESGVTEVSIEDIYSAWKEWVILSDNAKWPFAFRVVGGDPLTATLNAGSYFFLQNQNGWRIRPPEEDIQVLITGNFYREDISLPSVVPTIGDFNTVVESEKSSLTQVVGGAGLTAQDVANAVWAMSVSSNSSNVDTAGGYLNRVKKYVSNKLTRDPSENTYEVFEDDETTSFDTGDSTTTRRDPS